MTDPSRPAGKEPLDMFSKNVKKTAIAAAIAASVCFTAPLAAQERSLEKSSPGISAVFASVVDTIEHFVQNMFNRSDAGEGSDEGSRDIDSMSRSHSVPDPMGCPNGG